MAIGYFIRLGDKTTCGGRVISASSSIIHHGLPLARVGDFVTCGKESGRFQILTGIDNYTDGGISCAGTLESISSCQCRAKLYASEFSSSYEMTASSQVKSIAATKSHSEPVQHVQAVKKPVIDEPKPTPPPSLESKREPVDAGFCIVDLPSNVEDFGNYLFQSPVKGVRALYDSLNGTGKVKKGSILILVDPEKQDPHQVETLKKAKAKVDNALFDLTSEEADLLYKNKDAIDSFTAYGSKISGVASEVSGKYFEEIEKILKEIKNTYENAYLTRGALIGQQFYVERTLHFKKLNLLLNRFIKYRLGLSQYKDLRKALGLSSRSIMHRWDQAGVNGIEGYATYIDKSAKLIKAMKKLGYIGIALDFGNSTNKVYEACTIGRESECAKASFTEYDKFGLAQAGGYLGGILAGRAVSAVCLWGLGLATPEMGGAGALLCVAIGLTGTIGGAELGASYGGDLGESLGMVIYEAVNDK